MDVISFCATGHEHVRGTHESTLEVTTDDYLTPRGDCILGINATIAPSDLSHEFIAKCQNHDSVISVTLRVDSEESHIKGNGHPDLTFKSDRSFVFRTSSYIDERTVMVGADKAAADIDRELIQLLSTGKQLEIQMDVTRE